MNVSNVVERLMMVLSTIPSTAENQEVDHHRLFHSKTMENESKIYRMSIPPGCRFQGRLDANCRSQIN